MKLLKAITLMCGNCGITMDKDKRCCAHCGRVYSPADLQNMTAHQWAVEMRPLKLAITASAALTLFLIWFVLGGT